VRDLEWVIRSPSLLSSALAVELPWTEKFERLRKDSQPLRDFLNSRPSSGRLGNWFEALVGYALRESESEPIDWISGVAIREASHTQGELDLIFRPQSQLLGFEHWELAVKFYLCIARSPCEAHRLESYVGQALLDRLDLKLSHLIEKQLPLARTAQARAHLESLGFRGEPVSRLFMKGRLFYPRSWNPSEVRLPEAISPAHERGWWMAWNAEEFLGWAGDARWVILPKKRWLGRVETDVEPQSSREVAETLDEHFRTSRNAIQLARLQPAFEGGYCEALWPEAPGRGMILCPGWPSSGPY
jgi:hypothetical protein